MPSRNIRCSTGDLPRRILTSKRTSQRALAGKVLTENARGKFHSTHDYRCLQIMGYDVKSILTKKGLIKESPKSKGSPLLDGESIEPEVVGKDE